MKYSLVFSIIFIPYVKIILSELSEILRQNRKGFCQKPRYDIGVATRKEERSVSVYKEVIQDSIDYIEDNIKCEISAQELSERAGFSLFHYYRLFQTAVGLPVMQYILRRRLLNTIYEIECGNKMIDIALLYGFETHAGFYNFYIQKEASVNGSLFALYLVIFSCFTLWSITWRDASSFLISSSEMPISIISTIT